jgi:hypothetical protein
LLVVVPLPLLVPLPLRLVAGLLPEFGERLFVDLAGLNIMRRL